LRCGARAAAINLRTLVVGANIPLALQSIVARNLDPLKAGAVTVEPEPSAT
jgi:hypothetical protein